MLIPVLALVALTGCDDLVGNGSGLSEAEAALLSEGLVATTFDGTTDVATADDGAALVEGVAAATATLEFTHTRSCPFGGQVVAEGTREREWDRNTGTGSMTLALTRTHQACERPIRWQATDVATDTLVTITLDGAPDIDVSAHHQWADGHRSGIQSMTMNGAVDWVTSDGREGTCEIDLVAEFDPDTHTRTMTGNVCGHEIDRSATWQDGGMGGGPGGGMNGGGMGGGGMGGGGMGGG